jgi:hypothetical protein
LWLTAHDFPPFILIFFLGGLNMLLSRFWNLYDTIRGRRRKVDLGTTGILIGY